MDDTDRVDGETLNEIQRFVKHNFYEGLKLGATQFAWKDVDGEPMVGDATTPRSLSEVLDEIDEQREQSMAALDDGQDIDVDQVEALIYTALRLSDCSFDVAVAAIEAVKFTVFFQRRSERDAARLASMFQSAVDDTLPEM